MVHYIILYWCKNCQTKLQSTKIIGAKTVNIKYRRAYDRIVSSTKMEEVLQRQKAEVDELNRLIRNCKRDGDDRKNKRHLSDKITTFALYEKTMGKFKNHNN